MLKLWVKTVKGEKLLSSTMFNLDMQLTEENFPLILRTVCEPLDLDTPLALPSHYRHLHSFNNVKFKADSFVAPIYFDYLQIEVTA